MRAHCGMQRENRLSKLTQRHKRGHIELSQQLVVDVRLLGLERIVAEVLVDEVHAAFFDRCQDAVGVDAGAPGGGGVIVVGGPLPPTEVFFSAPPLQNPTQCPSGEKKGLDAPSVPAIDVAAG